MSNRLTTSQFIEKAKAIHGDRYEYSEAKYISAHLKVNIICLIHGRFKQTPSAHHNLSRGCPKCKGDKIRILKLKSVYEFIKEAKKVHDNRYSYSLVDYKTALSKIKIICKLHGIFSQTPNSHLSGHGCKKCSTIVIRKKLRLTTEKFIEKARTIHGDLYDYSLAEYKNNKTEIKIICNKHGVFKQKPNYHIDAKAGCQICRTSKGELSIYSWLKEQDIPFIREHIFSELKYKISLRFDFYLPVCNLLIEYDGQQHFDKNISERRNSSFKKIKERDKIKTRFARDNNIQLLRIPYWEFSNIDNILKNQLT